MQYIKREKMALTGKVISNIPIEKKVLILPDKMLY